MKQKKFLALVALVLVLVMCVGVFAACDKPGPTPDPGPGPDPGPDEPCTEHEDANADGKCDNCGADYTPTPDPVTPDAYDYVDPATCTHEDKDGNCVCDYCKIGLDHSFDANGKCATCGNTKRVDGSYTYQDSFATSPSTWNPHIYQTTDDSYPLDYMSMGLYGFFFNGDKSGYDIWPVMAAAYPEDVTLNYKSDSKWGIADSAESGFAYRIRLNEAAKWQDGTAINADTYIESYKLLLDPNRMNYRAADYLSGQLVFKNSSKYFYADTAVVYTPIDEIEEENAAAAIAAGKTVVFDVWEFWGLEGMVDANGNECPQWVSITDTTAYRDLAVAEGESGDWVSAADIWAAYAAYLDKGGPYSAYTAIADANDDLGYEWEDGVGLIKIDEYTIDIVLEKSLSGFYLLYNLSGNWIVDVDKYEQLSTFDPVTGYNNTYNTNVATSSSYGPYKLVTYQEGKLMEFERNENWFGYSDSRFATMFQTSKVTATYVKEQDTAKQMFLRGELEAYGLQAKDYTEYGMSDWFYSSPGTTIFFLVLNANEEALTEAQKAKENLNKTILMQDDFREALSLTFDKVALAKKLSPARTAAYSVVGAYDIWNPTTGEKYRDTEIAKTALVEYYGFTKNAEGLWVLNGVTYELDEAVDAITGYNPTRAQELFLSAYEKELAEGKIDADDIIEIQYAISADSDFMTQLINALNDGLDAILNGTVLEGRVRFTKSAPSGNAWSDNLKAGIDQTCMCGWNGGMLDPFNSMLYYLEPDHDPYAENWWDTTKEKLTLTLPVGENGADVDITMTLEDWSLCLTGDVKKVDGVEYNFGYGQVADDVRLTILASFEKVILATNYYIPIMQDASGFLLSKKVNYALGAEDYNAVLGRGGITYMTYNYDDAGWAAYVESCGGTLTY